MQEASSEPSRWPCARATNNEVTLNVIQEVKAWGRVRHLFDTPQCAVSVLEVVKGGYSSRHYHEWRINRFLVQSGQIEVVHYNGSIEERFVLNPGDVHDVPAKVVHRFEVIEPGIVIEVYWPAAGVTITDIKRLDTGGSNVAAESSSLAGNT